eukprot:1779508-Amphidinium_carterae.4
MSKDYTKKEDIGKAITDKYFTKTRLTQKQSGHPFWISNKEVQQPLDLEHAGEQQEEQSTLKPNTVDPPPGLEQPATYTYIHPTPKAMAKQDNYKPPHRLTSKELPPNAAQLDGISDKKEIQLENNEDLHS